MNYPTHGWGLWGLKMKGITERGIKVCSPEEMKRIDDLTAKEYGIPQEILMENAGTAVFSLILQKIGLNGKKFCFLAGTGNNGGDVLVAARRAFAAGGVVSVHIFGDPQKFPEPAKKNFELVKAIGSPLKIYEREEDIAEFQGEAEKCDVFVVGLIGIGLVGEVTGIRRKVIELINNSGKTVISVDIPSGISGINGKVCGVAVKSDYTVTFGLPKYGNILYPGYYYCGKLFISRLSYPPHIIDSDEIMVELNYPIPPPERPKWGHKGTFGRFLAIGGARSYYGAPFYVAFSFLKAGGGYSRLAAPKSVIPFVAARNSEIVFIPLEETSEGSIAKSNLEKLNEVVEEFEIDIVAIGSGASINTETLEFMRNFIEAVRKPLIIDGDGITAISEGIEILRRRKEPTIITPHLGEFSRLIHLNMSEISEDPIGILRKSCIDLNSYLILKGAHTMVCSPDGYIYINMTGNPGMAKAGMGDVLTGTIAAMYGIGFRKFIDAARMAVLVHGLAGDIASQKVGEDGVTPDDVIFNLPNAMKILRENPSYIVDKYMPKLIG